MSIAFVCPQRNISKVLERIRSLDATVKLEVWPEIQSFSGVKMAVLWKHPKGLVRKFSNLGLASSFGAGVDHLIEDSELSPSIPIVRIVDPSLSERMADYVVSNIWAEYCDLFYYYDRQTDKEWSPIERRERKDLKIGILGCGEIGSFVAKRCKAFGAEVRTWSRSKKKLDGVQTYSEQELQDFLTGLTHIVNLLPLTAKTRYLINRSFLKYPSRAAVLINVARAQHVVERDLLDALERGKLSRVVLDVFEDEPLQQNSKLWRHPGVRITPHIASITDPQALAEQCLENYHRLLSGKALLNKIDRSLGY